MFLAVRGVNVTGSLRELNEYSYILNRHGKTNTLYLGKVSTRLLSADVGLEASYTNNPTGDSPYRIASIQYHSPFFKEPTGLTL